MPTGNPNCPDDVRRAKRISKLIEERSECVNNVPVEDYGIATESLPPSVVAANTEGTPSTTTNTTSVRPLSAPRVVNAVPDSMTQMAQAVLATVAQRQEELKAEREERKAQRERDALQQTLMMQMLQKMTKDDNKKDA